MLVHRAVFTVVLFFMICTLTLSVSADMGPKPKLTVIVTNPPENEYYLDILVDYDLPLCDNLTGKRDTLDREKLKLLTEYNINGWYPALAHGTKKPVWGRLTGDYVNQQKSHRFGYFGLPDKYKIIIITPENNILVSPVIEKTSYSSTVYFDYSTGEVTEEEGLTLTWTYVRQFFMSLIPTLILEAMVLLIFRFKKAHTLIVFFITNICTQAVMTLMMSTSMLKLGIYSSYVVLFFVEIVIVIAEAAVYILIINEGKKVKRAAYAITANIISGFAMLPLMYLEYLLFID